MSNDICSAIEQKFAEMKPIAEQTRQFIAERRNEWKLVEQRIQRIQAQCNANIEKYKKLAEECCDGSTKGKIEITPLQLYKVEDGAIKIILEPFDPFKQKPYITLKGGSAILFDDDETHIIWATSAMYNECLQKTIAVVDTFQKRVDEHMASILQMLTKANDRLKRNIIRIFDADIPMKAFEDDVEMAKDLEKRWLPK